MYNDNDKKYLQWSIAAHAAILLVLTLNFYFASPTPVLQNTNKNDVISAVVLGDTAKSKILPQKKALQPKPEPEKSEPLPPVQQVQKTELRAPASAQSPKPAAIVKKDTVSKLKPDVIALKKADDNKKKLAEQKALDEKKRRDS